jgi:hypothetical protein
LSEKLGREVFVEALFVLVTYWGIQVLEVSLHIPAPYRASGVSQASYGRKPR